MELTTGSLLCHSQLPLTARPLRTQLPGVSVCLPGTRVPLPGLASPHLPQCSAGGWAACPPHAGHGGSVRSECRSSRLPPAPPKLTEAWRGRGLALGHTKVQAQQDMPPIVLPHYCLASLLSWDTSSLACPWLAPSTGPGALTDAGEEKAES